MATSPANFHSAITVAKGVLSTAASVTATAMLVHSMAQNIIPRELQDFLFSGVRGLFSRFSNELTVVIDEYDGLVQNELFEAAQTFLATRLSPLTQRIRVIKPQKEKKLTVAMERHERIMDSFRGVEVKWFLASRRVESGHPVYHGRGSTTLYEVQFFELTFHKKHKEIVLEGYLPFIVSEAKSLKQRKKTLKLFTPSYDRIYGGPLSHAWTPVNLDHPATFETLAMDSEQKEKILADLERFVRRKEYYRRVGKAWKRGYLLYGPPGTGKSSLVAAMANYLNFDVYDLELSGIRGNSELRRLLVGTANQSILVVEDIDCTIKLEDRKTKATAPHMTSSGFSQEEVTLSGFLNFIDGIWSSCSDERIIIFTTNHKEKLDSALLRPGRMDLHIHMSYCTPCGFRVLASNYLKIDHHKLFDQIENLIVKVQVTPAEVAEELMKSDNPNIALQDMIAFLEVKEKENREAKEKKSQLELEEKIEDQADLEKEKEEEQRNEEGRKKFDLDS